MTTEPPPPPRHPSSYEIINYSLRPAKHVERRMLAEAFGRLRAFGSLEEYRYVGFGSTYFADFTLFYRRLGFRHLLSIEVDEDNRSRFEFNKPYRFLEIRFGLSTSVLPTIPWNVRSIVWLDYDGRLDRTVLADIGLVASSCQSGSLILISVNAHPVRGVKDQLRHLADRIGAERIPLGTERSELVDWGLASVGRKIVDGAIRDATRARESLRGRARFEYRQLFNFQYQDGAMMSTVGGIIFDVGQHHLVDACGFDDFDFVRHDDDPYRIEVPKLTLREIQYLGSAVPFDPVTDDLKGIPEADIVRYAAMHRYFPHWIDVEP